MAIRARRAAVRELKTAEKKLAGLYDETDQTPRWWAANRRVAAAEENPHLPDRYRDPRDLED